MEWKFGQGSVGQGMEKRVGSGSEEDIHCGDNKLSSDSVFFKLLLSIIDE